MIDWKAEADRISNGTTTPAEHGADRCIYAEPFQEGCCHRRKVKCHHPRQPNLIVAERYCGDCLLRSALSDLHICAVITAWNEGDEVRDTVDSLVASVERAVLQVILVDDGSSDGSCGLYHQACVHVVRHETPHGVGQSRNAGWRRALEMGADVVTFHDAHMRFPDPDEVRGPGGMLEQLAVKAAREGAITTAASHDIPSRGKLRGCWMHYDPRYGLQPKWSTDGQIKDALGLDKLPEWWRTPCMMGACYAVPRYVGEALSEPTGQLWEDTAGRWGFSEQALAIKAWLMDVPVLQSRDLRAGHKYRGTNRIPGAAREVWKNVARSTRLLLGQEAYERYFRPWCRGRLGVEVERETVAGLDTPSGWPFATPDLHTHLLGIGARITERHPEHDWVRQRRAIEALADAKRVLAWRCNYFLVEAAYAPEADITCIEYAGHRAQCWQAACKEAGIHLVRTKLGEDYVKRPLKLAEIRGKWDLIIVGGEYQDQCLEVAKQVLTDGGRIIRNPAADRLQLEHGELKKERELLAELENPGPGASPSGGGAQDASAVSASGPAFNDRLEAGDRRPEVRQNEHRLEAGDRRPETTDCRPEAGGRRYNNNDPPDNSATAGPWPSLQSPASSLKPVVTVCLLNYQRPENLGPVLDSVRNQTLPVRTVLWDNAGLPAGGHAQAGGGVRWTDTEGNERPMAEHPDVDLVVEASRNLGCFPRWFLASLADTEFVCSMDDDLIFKDERVLEDAVAACREECPDGIVGLFGWSEVAGKDYRRGRHHNGTTTGTRCDIIKGRFMLFRRALLERVPLVIPAIEGITELSHREDDVYLSLCISGGEKDHHLVPERLGHRWRELSQHGVSAASEPGHYARRWQVIQSLKKWLSDQ